MDLVVFTVPRLFTPEIARYYEDYYMKKGIQFRKGNVLSSFECDESDKVSFRPLTKKLMVFITLLVANRYALSPSCFMWCSY